jgi:hypothetical protein
LTQLRGSGSEKHDNVVDSLVTALRSGRSTASRKSKLGVDAMTTLQNLSISMGGNTGFFGSIILNEYGSPNLADLNQCGAPAFAERPNTYLEEFVLNGVFTKPRHPEIGRILLMFTRRTVNAVTEYCRGRDLLLEYLQRLPQSNTHFLIAMRATTHFEQSIISASQAVGFIAVIGKLGKSPPLQDDRMERIRKIANRSKHFDEDIEQGKTKNTDITAPVWITNEGVSSVPASVTFQEFHAVLTELIQAVEEFK